MRVLSLLALLALSLPAADLRWISLPAEPLEIEGLPWYRENKGDLHRLPLRMESAIRSEVWNLAKSPSGARIRFRTDARVLAIRLEYPSAPNMANMHAFGQTGVDLYADGQYLATAIADKDAAPGKTYEKIYFDYSTQPRRSREITLYLSLYKPVKVLGIGVDAEASLSRPQPFALPKPVVFYGTSITQGGCASRSGLSYQAILGRRLNLDFVNLGFSGQGKGEPPLAAAVSEIDSAAIVLDYSQNNRTLAALQEVYEPFLAALRAKHPDKPILAITPIFATREPLGDNTLELEAMRAHIRQVISRHIAAGDRHLQLLEGTDLLGPAQADGLVDGVHPNDLGFQWMADGIGVRLRKMLALP